MRLPRLNDRLLTGSIIIFGLSKLGDICNIAFQSIISRRLSPEDFGLVNALISVIVITSIPTATILLVISKRVSVLAVRQDMASIKSLYIKSLWRLSQIGIPLLIALLAFSGVISSYFQSPGRAPVILTGAVVLSVFFFQINLGIIQGLQRFTLFGMGGALYGIARLTTLFPLLALGLGASGAISASLAAFTIATIILAWPIIELVSSRQDKPTSVTGADESLWRSAVPIMIALLLLGLLTHTDLIVARGALDVRTVGFLSAAVVQGKLLFYLPFSVVMALFPLASEEHARASLEGADNPESKRLLLKGVALAAALGGAAYLVMLIFPGLLLRIQFGEGFEAAVPYLRVYGLGMIFFGLSYVIMSYELARNRSGFLTPMAVLAVAEIVGIILFRTNALAISCVVLTGGLALFALLVFTIRRHPS